MTDRPTLDEAWAEVEPLLPVVSDGDGGWVKWRIGIVPWRATETSRWFYRAVALRPERGEPEAYADAPTPAAALLALARKLREDPR